MGNFCAYCGTKLEDGKTCDCQNSRQAPTDNGLQELAAAKEFYKDNTLHAKNFFHYPVNTICNLAHEQNQSAGIFFLFINAAIFAAMLLFIVKYSWGWITDLLGVILGSETVDMLAYVEIDYLGLGVRFFLFNLAAFLLFAVTVWACGKVMNKSRASLMALGIGLSIATLPLTVSYVLAILMVQFSLQLTMAILVVGFLMNQLLNAVAAREILGISENNTIALYPLSFVIYLGIGLALLHTFAG